MERLFRLLPSCHSERSEESILSCHSERSEESQDFIEKTSIEILRCAQNDRENDIEIILTFSNGTCFIEDYYFSPGYNQLKKSKRIVIEFDEEKLNWKLQFCKKEKNV